MKATKKQLEIIKNELINVFGSYTEAKKQAKKQYEKVEIEFNKWNSLPKRKQLYILPPSFTDTFLNINNIDKLYYSKHKGTLSARDGKGYYVRLKTRFGVMDYKIQ